MSNHLFGLHFGLLDKRFVRLHSLVELDEQGCQFTHRGLNALDVIVPSPDGT
jgi:hypothetical protein